MSEPKVTPNTDFWQPERVWSAIFMRKPSDPCTTYIGAPHVMVFASRDWLLWHFANLPWFHCTISTGSYIQFEENSKESYVACYPHLLPAGKPAIRYNEAKEAY